jgi:tetratricopeptide (TPR) repeat protein
VVRKSPAKAQAYYLLAYLREQQDRPADAIQPLRQAVGIDPQYLNAWAHLNQVGQRTWIEPGELDIARLKLLELDPLRRHVQYELSVVGDLPGLWRGAERAHQAAQAAQPIRDDVYPLRASADQIRKTRASLPEEMRLQMDQYERFANIMNTTPTAPGVLGQHSFVVFTRALMGGEVEPRY